MFCLRMIHTRRKPHLDIKDKSKCIQLTKNHTTLAVESDIASWYSLYPVSQWNRQRHSCNVLNTPKIIKDCLKHWFEISVLKAFGSGCHFHALILGEIHCHGCLLEVCWPWGLCWKDLSFKEMLIVIVSFLGPFQVCLGSHTPIICDMVWMMKLLDVQVGAPLWCVLHCPWAWGIGVCCSCPLRTSARAL